MINIGVAQKIRLTLSFCKLKCGDECVNELKDILAVSNLDLEMYNISYLKCQSIKS